MSYTALIRTFNSAQHLPRTLDSLARQNARPSAIVLVDSGSTDGTLKMAPQGATVVPYMGAAFNFSSALNQGFARVDTELTLVISSHTTLTNPDAVAYALDILKNDAIVGAAYFINDLGELDHSLVDATSFNGFNGIWNTCALIRTELVRTRPFRPEVFSAEDQEWSRWLVREQDGRIARVTGGGMDNTTNPNLATASMRKWVNEYVAIAYFVNPTLRGPRSIASLVAQSLTPFRRRTLGERAAKLVAAFQLSMCYVRRPNHSSRYFSTAMATPHDSGRR